MTKDRLKTWYYAYCTHTHPFNGPLSGTTQVSRYHRGKTNVDFTEARDSEWQWHQLGHMQVCTCSRQTTTPALHQSVFFTDRMPFLPPNQQRQSTEGNDSSRPTTLFHTTFLGERERRAIKIIATKKYGMSANYLLRIIPLHFSQIQQTPSSWQSARKIWNSLPLSLRTCTSPDTFCRHLKTHYCQQAFQST